jgi:hypothetical protein
MLVLPHRGSFAGGAGDRQRPDSRQGPSGTRKQAIDLQQAIVVGLRKRNGATVVGEGAPARWKLKGDVN